MSVETPTKPTPTLVSRAGIELSPRTLKNWIPLGVLLALVVAITMAQPSFLGAQSLRGLAVSLAPLLLLALGQMFVILTGGIDLAFAAVASLGTVMIALWVPDLGFLGAVVAIVITTAIGALNGWIVAFFQVPSFIVTLGALGLWGAVALWISGASTIRVSEGFEAISWLSDLRIAGIPMAGFIAVVMCCVIALVTKIYNRGEVLHGMGLAEPAILMSGISTLRWRICAFALSGTFAGLAALMMVAAQRSGGPTLADSLQLPGIAAVVVGGNAITGGVGGAFKTLIGAAVIVILRVGLTIVGVPPAWEQVFYGFVIIAAVALTIDRSRLKSIK